MKTRLTFTMILFVLITSVYGQLWQKNYTVPGVNFHDLNLEKLQDGSDDLVAAGAVFSNTFTNPAISIFRLNDADGSVLYQNTYQPSNSNLTDPRVFDVVRYNENGAEMIAMTGSVKMGGQNLLALIKVKASNGAFVDGAYFMNVDQNLDHSQGLHIIYTGLNGQQGFVVGGFANKDYLATTSDEHIGFVMRTDINFGIIWTTSIYTNNSYASYDYDMVNNITETDDGYFVTGSATGLDSQGTKQAVLAVRLSDSGGLLWDASYIHGNSRDVGADAYYDGQTDEIYLLTNYSVAHYFGITVFEDNTGTIDFSRTWRAYDWNDLDKYGFNIMPSQTDPANLVIAGYDRDASWYDENGNYITGQTVPFLYEFEKATGNQVGTSYMYHVPYNHPGGFNDYFDFWNAQMPLIYYPDIHVSKNSDKARYYQVAYRNQPTSGEVDMEVIEADDALMNACENSTQDFQHETIQFEHIEIYTGQLFPQKVNLPMQEYVLGYEVDSCNTSNPQDEIDFGDAPEFPGTPFMYPTTLANNGARHAIDPDIFLGNKIDPEADGQPSINADCDDTDCVYPSLGDDEDGVSLPLSTVAGNVVNITVTASVDGYLDAWMDFNIDSDWADAGEHIFMNQFVVAGANALAFTVPAGSSTGQSYLRFRFRTFSGTVSYDGLIENGEVEDYYMKIEKQTGDDLDFGDAPEDATGMFAYPTLLSSNGARHLINPDIFLGSKIDPEADGQPSAGADCDDNDCVYPSLGDDEDGVALPAAAAAGSVVPVTVVASVSGYLDAWMDFNLNGDWADAGEHIFNNVVVAGGANALSFSIPASAVPGQSYLRFRFRDYSGAITYKGMLQNGEVEDYTMYITDEPQGELDFGDAPEEGTLFMYATTLANNGARHIINPDIFLGNKIDPEADGQPSIGADCDDNDCFYASSGDDEDGVMLPATTSAGSTITMSVTASVSGYLDVWIDLNMNGNWTDAGEHIFATLPVSGGLNALTYTIPSSTPNGFTYLRFRFRDYNAPLSYDGLAENGEVEDYRLEIEGQQTGELDFGDAPDDPYPTLLANDGARHFNDGVTFLGDLIDSEPDGQPSGNALCDDNDCLYPALGDDEDGVTFVNKIKAGKTAKVDVVASVDGYLNAWIDFNKNGSWSDAGEQVFVDVPVSAGTNNLSFPVPSSAKKGKSYIRFRFATYPGLDNKGMAENGEVEDYRVRIYPKWSFVITDITHVIALPDDLFPLQPGDVVGAFHTNYQGEMACAGLVEIGENRNEVIVLYGDDNTTPDVKEGFVQDEYITWKVFSFQSEKEHDVTPDLDPELPNPENYFAANGISAILGFDVLTVFTSPDEASICLGTMLEMEAFAFGGSWEYTYAWTSNPAGFASEGKVVIDQPLQTTTYYVEVNDGLFTKTDSLLVTVAPVPLADAGPDIEVCGNQPVYLSGYAENYSAVEWQTMGDGSFDSFTNLDATYYSGEMDLEMGSVQLVLLAQPLDGCIIVAVDTMTVNLEEMHAIHVSSGWQGISSYLSPAESDIEEIMAQLGDNLTLMYNFGGLLWPEQGVNTIDLWNAYDAFVLKSVSEDTLYICGSLLDDLTMQLDANWNMIPVLCQTASPVEDVFAEVDGLVLVKEIGGGGVYWPNYNINTLGVLEAGRAYLGYASDGGSISYVGTCDAGALKAQKQEVSSPWNPVYHTAISHTVGVSESALADLQRGDIIGAFTSNGNCAGITIVDNGATALSLNGDDIETTNAGGYEDGELITYKLYRSSTGEEFALTAEYDADLDASGKFIANGMSMITSFKVSSTGVAEPALSSISVYPNPSNGLVNIKGVDQRSGVVITNTIGAVVYNSTVDGPAQLDLSDLQDGVYLVNISNSSGRYIEKLVIR